MNIVQFYGCQCPRRSFVSLKRPSDHTERARPLIKRDGRYLGIQKRLIPRSRHFVRLREIHPQLNRAERTALFSPLRFMEFFVPGVYKTVWA